MRGLLTIAVAGLWLVAVPWSYAQELNQSDFRDKGDTRGGGEVQDLPPLDEEVTVLADARLEALGKLEEYYRTTKSFTAPFTQRSPDGSIATGILYVERPGRVRFDYSDDIPLLVVSDGETLNLVDQEIGQVTKWPVNDTPLRLLLAETLDLSGLNSEIDPAPAGIEEAIAISATDPRQPELGRLTAYFEDSDSQGIILRGWSVIDSFGEQTTVTIGLAERNIDLSPALWAFKDPRGAARRLRRR